MSKSCKYKNIPDKTKTWLFPVFGYEIKVVSSNDIMKAMQKFKHTKNIDVEEHDSSAALSVHVSKEPLTYIFVPHRITLEMMVHEAFHAVRRMLKYHSINTDDNEIVAYHLGYLVQQISDWRWSWKRK